VKDGAPSGTPREETRKKSVLIFSKERRNGKISEEKGPYASVRWGLFIWRNALFGAAEGLEGEGDGGAHKGEADKDAAGRVICFAVDRQSDAEGCEECRKKECAKKFHA
jgi:hypothetical protein